MAITVGNSTSSQTTTATLNNNGSAVIVVECHWDATGGLLVPSGFTVGSTAMSLVASSSAIVGNFEVSMWVLPVGATLQGNQTITATFADTPSDSFFGAVSVSGVSQSTPTRTASTNNGSSTAASISPGSQFSNDLVIGGCFAFVATNLTSGGSPQSNVIAVNDGVFAFSVDDIPGTGSASLAWTLASSSVWFTTGAALIPASSGGASAPSPCCLFIS